MMLKDKHKTVQYNHLVIGISQLLSDAKNNIARTENATMIITNWHIGEYIVEYEQGGKERAEYGAKLLRQLSTDFSETFGRGYSYRNLQLFKKFYQTFPIVQTLTAQSSALYKPKAQTSFAEFSNRKA